MSKPQRLTSNDLIGILRERPLFVVKTLTRVGPVYSLSDRLVPIPREVVERQIDKGILVAREASGQSFELSAAWRGQAA